MSYNTYAKCGTVIIPQDQGSKITNLDFLRYDNNYVAGKDITDSERHNNRIKQVTGFIQAKIDFWSLFSFILNFIYCQVSIKRLLHFFPRFLAKVLLLYLNMPYGT